MLKFSDALEMVKKKINRNNIMYDVFELCQKLAEDEIKMREKLRDFYEEQKKALKHVNEIENLQCAEYTAERQDQVLELMKDIGRVDGEDFRELLEEIKKTKEDIKYKTEIMKHIQEFIPKTGVATNYTIHTNDENQTCASASRFI